MARDELLVIDRTYELVKWFLRRLEKFPRSHRYGLGQQIEQHLYAVFGGLLRAKYLHAKVELLNLELDVLCFQLRLAKNLGVKWFIPPGEAEGPRRHTNV